MPQAQQNINDISVAIFEISMPSQQAHNVLFNAVSIITQQMVNRTITTAFQDCINGNPTEIQQKLHNDMSKHNVLSILTQQLFNIDLPNCVSIKLQWPIFKSPQHFAQ